MKLDQNILVHDRNYTEFKKYAAKLQSIPMNKEIAIVVKS